MNRTAKITLNFDRSRGIIDPFIYGHFTEHIGGVFYDGLWVGQNSAIENIHGFRKALVESLKKIRPSVLRWPGGCFAETYDWRDGIGPKEKRPKRAGWWYQWDHRIETNQVGTHEFIDFCHMVGAEPYIAVNITSLTPLQIRNWMEYCNFPQGTTSLAEERERNGASQPFNVRLWGIGNENWGGGGQMSPEMYVREYVRYATICNNLLGDDVRFLLCGANGRDLSWTRRVMKEWSSQEGHEKSTWALATHYYCGTAGNPQDYSEAEWYCLLSKANLMREIVDEHRAEMDVYDPERRLKIAIDEWGCWHKEGTGPSKGYNLFEQQSSMREAVVTALTLNIFNNRCDVVCMSNVAQLCNNLHSLYLAKGDQFVETPNYYVYDLYKSHQGAKQVEAIVDCESLYLEDDSVLELLSASASLQRDILTITMANLDMTHDQEIHLSFRGESSRNEARMTVLHTNDPHAVNTFENPSAIIPYTITVQDIHRITVPAASVVSLQAKLR